MIFTNSGKCHPYHSLTRMTNVLMSLSKVSINAIAWIIMLSERLTLNFTFALEYECAKPNCAFS